MKKETCTSFSRAPNLKTNKNYELHNYEPKCYFIKKWNLYILFILNAGVCIKALDGSWKKKRPKSEAATLIYHQDAASDFCEEKKNLPETWIFLHLSWVLLYTQPDLLSFFNLLMNWYIFKRLQKMLWNNGVSSPTKNDPGQSYHNSAIFFFALLRV